jgi:hypothetical protein
LIAVNKATVVSATIAFALLFFSTAEIRFVDVAKGNPFWGLYPAEPNQDKPLLIIENPANYTTPSQDSVILNFTVVKPISWNHTVAPFGTCADGSMHNVTISLNGLEKFQELLPGNDLNGSGAWSKSYSISIDGLQTGENILEIAVFADALYFNENSTNNTVSHYPLNVASSLYMNYPETPTPTPTLLPIFSPSISPTQQPVASSSAPEFPSWILLPFLLMGAALGAILVRKKKD